MKSVLSKKIYTAAIVGTGRIGFSLGLDKKREQPASHTMALNANPRIKIIAGVDTNPKNLARWKKANRDAETFATVAEAVAGTPDIVVVAVNEDAHLPITLKVLSYKPRLLILEKPVALNLKEAAKIKAAAKKYGVPILVNHERRFAADWNLAAAYLQKIGDLQSIDARLFSGMRLYDPDAEGTGGYSLLHDGTHLVDIVLFLLEQAAVTGSSNRQQESVQDKSTLAEENGLPSNKGSRRGGVELKNPVITGVYHDKKNKKIIRNLSAHYTSKNCPSVTLTMSGRSRFFGFEVDIIGTEGRVFIGNGFAHFYRRAESKLYSGFYSLEEDKNVELPKKGGRVQTGYFANMVQNAVDFLDGKAELKSTLQTGINALKALEEIKQLIINSE